MSPPAAFLNPTLARKLPSDSRTRVLAEQSLRLIWHAVFDDCPTLGAAQSGDADAFEAFCIAGHDAGWPTDWRLPLSYLAWIAETGRPDRLHFRELLSSAAARWATRSLSAYDTLIVNWPEQEIAILGERAKSMNAKPRVVSIEVLSTASRDLCFASTMRDNLDSETPSWRSLSQILK